MGDLCDANDIDRFMRSEEGRRHLNSIIRMLKGKTIQDVRFTNDTCRIAVALILEDGLQFDVFRTELDVDVLREDFEEVIEREYYKDFPERR